MYCYNPNENYINLGISYGYDSKNITLICFTILRRIHNRTADICTKNINCVKAAKFNFLCQALQKTFFKLNLD